ncbi:hypothetical protein [Streptomyces sp. NPDC015131]|uniref:hypothetical protein n=1 Tax=Streptomyces sp. NPDC015131 TaxID=3364941 RepID=UPI0036F7CAA5
MSAPQSTWRFTVEATDSNGRRGTHSGFVDSHSEAAARQGVIESVQAAGYQPCSAVTLKATRA